MINQPIDPSLLPLWAQAMELSEEQLVDAIRPNTNPPSLKDQTLYQGTKRFAEKHQISFYLCSAYVLDLYSRDQVSEDDVEKYLGKKLKVLSQYPSNMLNSSERAYKTILLTGASGEGKSTLTNHLTGKEDAEIGTGSESKTVGCQLYVSDQCKLNIIDTEGFDCTKPESVNQRLMEEIKLEILFYLELEASLDAIIVMWCPQTSIRSKIEKTIQLFKKSFGDDIEESCIVMIHGDWESENDETDRTPVVTDAKERIKKAFPNVPIIDYDGKKTIDIDTQLPILNEAIQKVKPYKATSFEEYRQKHFFKMIQVFQIKTRELENTKEFCKKFQLKMSELLKNRGEYVEQKKKYAEGFLRAASFVLSSGGLTAVTIAASKLSIPLTIATITGATTVAAGGLTTTAATASVLTALSTTAAAGLITACGIGAAGAVAVVGILYGLFGTPSWF